MIKHGTKSWPKSKHNIKMCFGHVISQCYKFTSVQSITESYSLGSEQNLSGTRAGQDDRGARTFFQEKKEGAGTFFQEKNGGTRTFFKEK